MSYGTCNIQTFPIWLSKSVPDALGFCHMDQFLILTLCRTYYDITDECGIVELQMSLKQETTTQRIARLRIHVEKSIERIKDVKILNGTVTFTLISG